VRRQHLPGGVPGQHQMRTAVHRAGDLVAHRVQLVRVDDRSELGLGVAGIADAQLAGGFQEALYELVVHGRGDDHPVDRDGDLAMVQVVAEHRAADGVLQVCVVEYRQWSVTSEFQGQLLRAGLPRAHLGGSGERHHPRDVMGDHRVADLAALADHHVEHRGRQAGFLVDLRQQQPTGDRGVPARLEHHRVARPQRRRHRPVGQVQREVPRTDHPDHTDRTPVDATFLAGNLGGQDTPDDPGRERHGLQHVTADDRPLPVGLGPRAPGLGDQPAQDLLSPVLHDLRGPAEHSGPIVRGGTRPLPLRVPGAAVGGVHVAGIGQRDLGEVAPV
jgi:hypothetical protein